VLPRSATSRYTVRLTADTGRHHRDTACATPPAPNPTGQHASPCRPRHRSYIRVGMPRRHPRRVRSSPRGQLTCHTSSPRARVSLPYRPRITGSLLFWPVNRGNGTIISSVRRVAPAGSRGVQSSLRRGIEHASGNPGGGSRVPNTNRVGRHYP
jgi:hypothetical protein